MKLTFDEVMQIFDKLKAANFFSQFSEKYPQISEVPLTVYDESYVVIELVRTKLFGESEVAPINPNIKTFEDTLNAYLVKDGTKFKLGEFSVDDRDLDPQTEDMFNLTIAESIQSRIKEEYFFNWYRQNIGPLTGSNVPYDHSLGMVKDRLADFGYQVTHMFDGTMLNISVFKEEPFEIIWSITQQSKLDKNLASYPRPFIVQMAYEVFGNIFFNEGKGFNTVFEVNVK